MLVLIFLLLYITDDTCKIYYDKIAKKYSEIKEYGAFTEVYLTRMKWEEGGEKCIMKSSLILTLHQCCENDQIKSGRNCSMHGGDEKRVQNCFERKATRKT